MNREYKIALSQEYYSDIVYLSQYDSDYDLVFSVLDKYSKATQIDGYTAKFQGTRTDGLGFLFEGTASDDRVAFRINTSLTAISGTHKGEIVFYDASGLFYGSANVQIVVEPAARPDGTIDADVERAEEIAEQIQQIVDTAAEQTTAEAERIVSGLEDEVSELKSGFNALEYTTPITIWVQGTIGASNGLNSDSNTRCRTNGYFTNHDLGFGTVKIQIATGLRLAARIWDSEMGYVGAYPSDWVSGELEMPVQVGYSYRFVVSKSNNGAITPSDIPADGIQIVVSGYTDDKIKTTGKPADAMAVRSEIKAYNSPYNGRTSTILAAKEYSHADGTHPTIDWYLLCDYAGDMYISKDLKSRTYITKKIDWNQYKYAVRANGDIIAVYRTEFITGTAEYDSSLDNLRQNPLVCLASEGYATWHEVDFGTSLKPCGWVENSGVCLLPNGDLLFGEYTRMLVNWTSNLWRIKAGADVTLAASWEVLKSFRVAENDTDTMGYIMGEIKKFMYYLNYNYKQQLIPTKSIMYH